MVLFILSKKLASQSVICGRVWGRGERDGRRKNLVDNL